MRQFNLIILAAFLVLLGLVNGCTKPSNIDSAGAGTPVTGGSAVSALVLSAPTNTIAPSSSTVITARVVDALGNNVPDGTIITFSFAPGDQVKASLSASSAQTVSGSASVTITASTTNAIVTVKAAAGSATGSIAITITAGSSGGTVAVFASPTTLNAGNTSTITATVKNINGNPVSNATVNFSLNNNTLASLSLTSVQTNASGVATTTLTGNNAGSVIVSAQAPSLSGATGQTTVTINPVSTVPAITLSTSSASILTNGNTTIFAQLSGFSPVSGLTINFSVNNTSAATLSAASAVTDVNGVATITLTAKNIVTPVTVTASYPIQSLTGTTTVTITAPPPDTVTLGANPASITVYGTTTLTALVTGASQSVPDGTLVNFILSDSTFGSLSNTTGSTVNGKATTTFSAVGKPGTVSISVVAGSVSNSATVTISPAATGSIQFVSAVPQVIGIQGSGQTETSIVTFAVKDINGNPVADGTQVTFTMQGPGGGAYIGPTAGSATATAATVSGNASVILHSGTTAGPVTIIATTSVSGGTISSSANQISIGGGVPSATHFNIATSQFNLPGLVVSGKQASISAYIADRFGNYNILKGTSVSYYTEAGAIISSTITDQTGISTATFRTQAPDPAQVAIWGPSNPFDETALINDLDSAGTYSLGIPVGNAIHPRNGWLKVVAAVQGEESFLDENGDGLFTRSISSTSACPAEYTCECDNGTPNTYAGCITSQSNGFQGGTGHCIAVAPLSATPATCVAAGFGGSSRSEGFKDIGEPFIDVNDDGCRNDGSNKNCGGVIGGDTDPFELFVDANLNGVYDPPNGTWDGPSCKTPGCLTSKMIWTDITLAFTGNAQYCAFGPANFSLNIPYGSYQTFKFMVGDVFTNNLVPKTTVSVALSGSGGGTLSGQTSYTVPDGLPSGPTEISFTVAAPPACTCAPTPCTCTNPPPAPFTITGTAASTDVVGCTKTLNGTYQ